MLCPTSILIHFSICYPFITISAEYFACSRGMSAFETAIFLLLAMDSMKCIQKWQSYSYNDNLHPIADDHQQSEAFIYLYQTWSISPMPSCKTNQPICELILYIPLHKWSYNASSSIMLPTMS